MELIENDVVFFVDGRLKRFGDRRQAALAYAVVNSHPCCLTFEKIYDVLSKKSDGIGGFKNDLTLNEHYVRKKIMGVNSLVKQATGSAKLIRNLRGEGYFLDNAWTIPQLDPFRQVIIQDIENLKKIVTHCIDIVNRSTFAISPDGAKSIVIDADASQPLSIFHEMRSRIFAALANKNCLSSDFINVMSLMETYVSFQRSGNNITDEAWRAAYRREVAATFKEIASHLDLHNVL